MEGLTEGRIVHFVMANGVHRPAIVVQVWNKETGLVNLQVFTDGLNDAPIDSDEAPDALWTTSIFPDETEKKPGTWHWIEKA